MLSVIQAEHYTPNVCARGLNSSAANMVGIIYSDASDLYLANAVYHLEREFRKIGFDSLICCCGYSLERRVQYINLMISKKVDAIILAGSHFVEAYDEDNDYIRAAAQQVPIGILSGKVVGDNIACAYCDDKSAVRDAAAALFRRGAKQIVFLYSAVSYSVRKKIEGLRQAFADQNVAYRDRYAIYCPISDLDLCAEYLCATRRQFCYDAILCTDDAFAVSAMKFARREGLAVPGQLRIIGYNNSVLSRCASPEISTVDNQTQALCVKLVEMVEIMLTKGVAQQQFSLPGKLILRETT